MNYLITAILTCIYPLLMLCRLLNRLCGRDPLRMEPPPDQVSYWIERGPEPSRVSYFSEASETEGRGHGGFGCMAVAVIGRLGRWMAPSLKNDGKEFRASAEREQDIPDEVYTLW